MAPKVPLTSSIVQVFLFFFNPIVKIWIHYVVTNLCISFFFLSCPCISVCCHRMTSAARECSSTNGAPSSKPGWCVLSQVPTASTHTSTSWVTHTHVLPLFVLARPHCRKTHLKTLCGPVYSEKQRMFSCWGPKTRGIQMFMPSSALSGEKHVFVCWVVLYWSN